MNPSVSLAPFAAFYFAYFAFLGLFSPFWGPYLASLSFSAWQISVLISLSTFARIVAPGLWGALADHLGRRRPIIVATSLAAAGLFALVGVRSDFDWLFGSLALALFFWAAPLPLVEAGTAELTRGSPGRYSRVRLWGSVGFIVLSVGAGFLLDTLGIAALPWLATATLVAVAGAACALPEVAPPKRAGPRAPIGRVLSQRPVLALFAVVFLMAFAHGPYYVFYSIALEGAGYPRDAVGLLWAAGVGAEVLMFWLMPRLTARWPAARLMQLSLAAAVLRFALIASALPSPALAIFAQLMHGLTFGVHHAAAVALLHDAFEPHQRARAQGLYIVAGFGVGGSLGGLASGVLWPVGGAPLVFGVSALAALAACALGWRSLAPRDPDCIN